MWFEHEELVVAAEWPPRGLRPNREQQPHCLALRREAPLQRREIPLPMCVASAGANVGARTLRLGGVGHLARDGHSVVPRPYRDKQYSRLSILRM